MDPSWPAFGLELTFAAQRGAPGSLLRHSDWYP